MPEIDVLIVGQGLSGTALAFRCFQQGKRFLVVDAGLKNGASHLAAGVINPITGRRFAKSWMYETLETSFLTFYEEISKLLGKNYLRQKPIYRLKDSVKNINDWDVRATWPSHEPFLSKDIFTPIYANKNEVFGKILRGYQLMIVPFLEGFRDFLKAENRILEEVFDYHLWDADKMQYGQWSTKNIVFCEGTGMQQNPWFNWLPMTPAKGEMLHIEIPEGDPSILYKRNFYVAHLYNNIYWYGATYDHEELGAQPTEEKRKVLEANLKEEVFLPVKIMNHHSAHRPTVPDRRPYLGESPYQKKHYIFNGMGSKGSSLVPYFSQLLMKHIFESKLLPREVDIRRIQPK